MKSIQWSFVINKAADALRGILLYALIGFFSILGAYASSPVGGILTGIFAALIFGQFIIAGNGQSEAFDRDAEERKAANNLAIMLAVCTGFVAIGYLFQLYFDPVNSQNLSLAILITGIMTFCIGGLLFLSKRRKVTKTIQ